MAQKGTDTDIQFLPGVGPKRAALLKKELAVETVGQLLRIYPFRYIDRSSFVRIADMRPDMAFVQFRARVQRVDLYGNGNSLPLRGGTANGAIKFNTVKRMSALVSDGSGEIEVVFFKGIKWMYEKLKPGTEFILGWPCR